MPAYTDKVDLLLRRAVEFGFTKRDFIELAVAAADQADMSPTDQDLLRAVLQKEL